MSRRAVRRRWRQGDAGAAMIITLSVMALLTALAVTVTAVSVKNVANSTRDRQATSALALSEAGVAQAISYLRYFGSGDLLCAPDCGAANPWGEAADDGDDDPGAQVTVAPGETYEVWIDPLQHVNIPERLPGQYVIHSVGNAGVGPGARTVEVTISADPFDFPLAVVANTVEAGGNGGIHHESLISAGCIYKRSHTQFEGIDIVHDIPAAAHSTQYITDANGSGFSCPADQKKNVHHPENNDTESGGVCNTAFPYDSDRQGGALSGTSCYQAHEGRWPETSLTSSATDIEERFGFDPTQPLSDSQLDQLRTAAQEQGFYFENTTAVPAVLQQAGAASTYPHPILFYDLKDGAVGGLVDLNDFDDSYGRVPSSATAASCNPANVLVVVVNGNVKLNSNSQLTGSVFALGPDPYGRVTKANGTSQLIGTIYARNLDLTGTADIHMDECFLRYPPGGFLDIEVQKFEEVDR